MASKKLLQSQVVMLSLGSGVYGSCVCVGNPFSAILDGRLLKQGAGSPALEFGFYDPSCQSALDRMAGGSIFPIDLGRRDGWDSCAAIATAPLSTMKVDAMLANSAYGGRDQADPGALSGSALQVPRLEIDRGASDE